MVAPNPFMNKPSPYADETIPWYMGGGGSGGPLGGGVFPAAPQLNRQLPAWDPSMLAGPAPMSGGPMPAPAMGAPQGQPFNAYLDPSAGGWRGAIGALMGNPTRAENQKTQMGAARSAGLQKLGELSQQMDSKSAILAFIKSPEGAQFVANSNDPAGEIKEYLAQISTDPTQAIRGAAFGAPPAEGTGGVDPATGQITNPELAPGRSQVEYLKSAEFMSLHGDEEGAKLAVQMAEEARQAASQQQAPYDEPSIKRYNAYVQQENAAGRPVKSYEDYTATQTKAGVQNLAGEPINSEIMKRAFAKMDSAEKSENAIQSYRTYAMLAKGVDTNWLKGATLPLQQGLRSIGFEFNADVPILESMQALSNKLALGARGYSELSGEVGLPGTTSNKDLSFLVNSVPNIWNTSLANEAILIIMTAQARRQSLLASAEANYLTENNTPAGWMDERRKVINDTAFFEDEEMATLLSLNEQGKSMPKMVAPEGRMGDMAPMPDDFFPDDALDVRQDAWNELHKDDVPEANPDVNEPIHTEPKPDAPPAPKSPMAPKGDRLRKK